MRHLAIVNAVPERPKLDDLLPYLEAMLADAFEDAGQRPQRSQIGRADAVWAVEVYGQLFPQVDFVVSVALDWEGVPEAVDFEVSAGYPAEDGDYLVRGEGEATVWLEGKQLMADAEGWRHAFWLAFRGLEGVSPPVAALATAWRERVELAAGVPPATAISGPRRI